VTDTQYVHGVLVHKPTGSSDILQSIPNFLLLFITRVSTP